MNDNWLNKYYSNSLDDYDNNQDNINTIIDSINDSCINSIIIKGDTGIGKNNIINLIAKKLKYKKNIYKLNNKKDILLEEYYNNINKFYKQLLIINKVDYVTTINEKKNIQNINKKLNNSKKSNVFLYFIENNN